MKYYLKNYEKIVKTERMLKLEELQKEDIPTVTTTKEITVQKQDGKWKVVADDNLKEAIFPGLQESLDAVTNGDMF